MTMASLSASLISRHSSRQVERKTGELVLLAPKVKAEPVRTAPKPIRIAAEPTKGKSAGNKQRSKQARQRKTLRLMRETHRALRTLATEKGVSQQSLMETAVETLLKQEGAKTANH